MADSPDTEHKGVAKGAPGPHPPIEMLFQIVSLNFSGDMSKLMHYFSNKFSKIAKRQGFSAPSAP